MPVRSIARSARRAHAYHLFVLAVTGALVAGCSMRRVRGDVPRWELNGRPARELPTYFLADSTPMTDPRAPLRRVSTACPMRLVDPRDGTRLVLEHSQEVGTNTAVATGTTPELPASAPATARERTPRAPPAPARELRGDYRVVTDTLGRYGVGPGERLRVECLTQRVVGIVGKPAQE